MTMRSKTSPRRIYIRTGKSLLCFGGLYYGPSDKKPTVLDKDLEVTCEVLPTVGGRKRVEVTQMVGDKRRVENWVEKHIVFAHREAAAEAAEGDAAEA